MKDIDEIVESTKLQKEQVQDVLASEIQSKFSIKNLPNLPGKISVGAMSEMPNLQK